MYSEEPEGGACMFENILKKTQLAFFFFSENL